ncbi:DUF4230 domain-containing protein [Butyrivibrio sp. LC3010]|uniref:DUF4230 domain-containing protein n=1 Tax=Butyrivibrio sp. LC3010 TaxID=1280680 RepID=UPI000413CF61|nr:DUF4230 domain-containing protein [Butyrivibrio sp. LC3010]
MDSFKKASRIFYLLIITISVIAIIILLTGYIKSSNQRANEQTEQTTISKIKPKEDKTLVSISTETIQDGLSNMGILMTQEYYFTQVETYTKEKNIWVIPTSSEFVYSYDGSVMAGIDFEKIQINKDDDKKTILVILPESEIQAVTIDKDTFRIYSENESLWNPLKLEDYNISLAEFENTAKQKALDSGILERSDEQAKNLVMNFIRNFPQMSGYTIDFK